MSTWGERGLGGLPMPVRLPEGCGVTVGQGMLGRAGLEFSLELKGHKALSGMFRSKSFGGGRSLPPAGHSPLLHGWAEVRLNWSAQGEGLRRRG